jgi:hypothetical protein
MLEGRTVFHVYNEFLKGVVQSSSGERITVAWDNGTTGNHLERFLCDEFTKRSEAGPTCEAVGNGSNHSLSKRVKDPVVQGLRPEKETEES